MLARGSLRPGCSTSGNWAWTRDGEQVANVGYTATLRTYEGELTLNYSVPDRDSDNGERKAVTCRIRLSSLPLHFGGRRWYAHCPYTHRRALRLYKFSGIDYFCHRTAVRPLPTYASQRVSGSDRINAQRWAIRRKLGDDESDLGCDPIKPKWMRWRTFERYAARDDKLAERDDVNLARLLGRLMRMKGS